VLSVQRDWRGAADEFTGSEARFTWPTPLGGRPSAAVAGQPAAYQLLIDGACPTNQLIDLAHLTTRGVFYNRITLS
jgi:hypothetical protein